MRRRNKKKFNPSEFKGAKIVEHIEDGLPRNARWFNFPRIWTGYELIVFSGIKEYVIFYETFFDVSSN